ncbi:hypothetical protein COLO4_16893 [Corchorus olitorius]|uniref:Uncharacterized protein n=1 Tax=Corchorus olitorius TaxID=93759 RepID=A0A1R3JFB9_9ROSI|nr:hypothetical protein COLO4_16893 [Corchorus olitorius]
MAFPIQFCSRRRRKVETRKLEWGEEEDDGS